MLVCIDPKVHIKEDAFGISQKPNRNVFVDSNLLWICVNNQISLALTSPGDSWDNTEV